MATLADTPQGRRRERIAARLQEALAALRADPAAELTASALARRAGIGRNALYTNHRSALEDLRDLQAERSPMRCPNGAPDEGGGKGDGEVRIRALATENASLLRRALIAETRVKRLEERNADLVRQLRALRKVTVMPAAGLSKTEE